MLARHTWTIALSGAMVVWLSSVGDLGRASPPDQNRIVPATMDAGTPAKPAMTAPVRLVDILLSGDGHDRAYLAVPGDGGRGSSMSGPATAERSPVARRLGVNAARQKTVERTLPRTFVLVNIPQARLWMVRDGEIQGSMRVVVGRPDKPTPEMITELTHVILNPRWNVPQDILRSQLAPTAALTRGRSISQAGYEVMSGWDDDATLIPPGDVDWSGVAAGRVEAAVHQRPGLSNAMGSAKFVMTNDEGIYLHDSPDRALFAQARRTRSAGCVRVEDYRRLMDFLLPEPLPAVRDASRPTYVRLGEPMPIYLTYITALASDDGVVRFHDPYGLDA